jgi:hypothetical protein
VSGAPFRFRDKATLAALLAALSGMDPKDRPWHLLRHRTSSGPRLPRRLLRTGRPGPYNKDQECARRRRQIAKGMLKVVVR